MSQYYSPPAQAERNYTDMGKPRSIWLTVELVEIAKRLGHGSISAGVRIALESAHDHKETDQVK